MFEHNYLTHERFNKEIDIFAIKQIDGEVSLRTSV